MIPGFRRLDTSFLEADFDSPLTNFQDELHGYEQHTPAHSHGLETVHQPNENKRAARQDLITPAKTTGFHQI